MRILVVDDEALLARAAARALLDHEVVLAGSVAEAVALLQTNQFDLIVSDMMMPGGTGVDLHRWVVENQPALARRFLFTSGGMPSWASAYIETVGLNLLKKPYGLAHLSAAVREHLLGTETPPGA